LAEAELVGEIRAIHARSRGAYGCPRVVGKLHQQGRQVDHKRVERLMAVHGLRGRCGHRRVRTTIRAPHATPSVDLVERRFGRDRLDELWLGDITYIPTGEGWLYMSSVLDACSRRLLGWSLAEHMRTEIVADAFEAAVGLRGGRRRVAGVVFHSDHGSQYTSDQYRRLCARLGVTQSMGTVGDSYVNAMAESFWASLKRELVDWSSFATRAEARAAVFEWANWYNHERLLVADASTNRVRADPPTTTARSMTRVRLGGGCSDVDAAGVAHGLRRSGEAGLAADGPQL
jgi:transposase InsO family protein